MHSLFGLFVPEVTNKGAKKLAFENWYSSCVSITVGTELNVYVWDFLGAMVQYLLCCLFFFSEI